MSNKDAKTYQIFVRECEESGVIIIDRTDFPGLHLEADDYEGMYLAIRQVVPELFGNLNLDKNIKQIVVKVYKEEISTQMRQSNRTPILFEQEFEVSGFAA